MNGATTYDVMPFINWNVYLMINIENDRSFNSFFQNKDFSILSETTKDKFCKTSNFKVILMQIPRLET